MGLQGVRRAARASFERVGGEANAVHRSSHVSQAAEDQVRVWLC